MKRKQRVVPSTTTDAHSLPPHPPPTPRGRKERKRQTSFLLLPSFDCGGGGEEDVRKWSFLTLIPLPYSSFSRRKGGRRHLMHWQLSDWTPSLPPSPLPPSFPPPPPSGMLAALLSPLCVCEEEKEAFFLENESINETGRHKKRHVPTASTELR